METIISILTQTLSALSTIKRTAIVKAVRWATVKHLETCQDSILQVPSRDAGRSIKVHEYRPASSKAPSPVLINFHGSGFVAPLHGSDDTFARLLAKRTDYIVLDCSYRLAPESPFPAAPNDAEDIVRWVLSQPEQYDSSRISLSGFSAGANLSLGLSGNAFPKDTFKHVVAFYPPVDLSKPAGERPPAPDPNGKPIPAFLSTVFDECYAPTPVDRSQELISPAFCSPESFTSRVLFITCSGDGLCVDAENLAKRIESVPGNTVVLKRMEGCDHGWDKHCEPGTPGEEARNQAYETVIDFLSR